MTTRRRSPPRPTRICLSRSWASGRCAFMPWSSIAMALASAGPIQMGSTRVPSFSLRITTGVLVVRSRPRCATVTSIIPLCACVPARQVYHLLGRERIDGDAHALQLESGDLLVHGNRQAMYRLAQRLPFLGQQLGREGLI